MNRFAEFGSNQEIGLHNFWSMFLHHHLLMFGTVQLYCLMNFLILLAAKAAKEGLDSDRQVSCCILFAMLFSSKNYCPKA